VEGSKIQEGKSLTNQGKKNNTEGKTDTGYIKKGIQSKRGK